MATACPQRDRLDALLAGDSEPNEVQALTAHLDSCLACQSALERLASGELEIAAQLRDAAARPPRDAAYWAALRRVQFDLTETVLPGRDTPGQIPPGELTLDFLAPPEKPGYLGRLQHFDVLDVIGHGGMGLVLRAFDSRLQRFVALKVLDPRLASSDLARRRFCREARAAASISHENVVAIYQVLEDEAQDLPLLVMQLVTGQSLQDRLDRGPALAVQQVVDIGAQIAAGLSAAHAQGLVHRDIKPGNILLERDSDRVRLTDFGLVRAVEDARLTQTGFVGGTPLYMAPEQARGEAVDHRTDLFSLGGVLYAMCAGRPPFTDSTPFLILQRITQEPHRPIRELNPRVPEYLSAVIDKLLAKHPDERLQSASEVARILHHHHAVLVSAGQVRCIETERPRPPRGLRVLSPVLLACVVSVALTSLLWWGVGRRANSPADARVAERGGTWITSPAAELPANSGPIWSLAFSPRADELALALDDGTLRIWDVAERAVRTTIPAHRGPLWCVAYDPAGGRLATASDDGRVVIWATDTWTEVAAFEHGGPVRSVAFSPDGGLLASGSRGGTVQLWDVASGRSLRSIDAHAGVVMALGFAPDGQTLVSGGSDKLLRIWDTASGRIRLVLEGHEGGVYAVDYSPDGQTVISGSWDKTVRVWDAATGDRRATLAGHDQDVWTVAFSPRGDRFASGSEDRTVNLWQLGRDTPRATFDAHSGTVYGLDFSGDGRRLATGGRDGSVLIWELP